MSSEVTLMLPPALLSWRENWDSQYVRATEADWRPLVDEMTRVQQLVHLTARMGVDDVTQIGDRLFNEGRETYRQSLQAEVSRWGCTDRAITPTAGAELTAIRERADFAAESIVGTYNLNLARAIIAIGEDTPAANRHVYAFRLFKNPTAWDKQYWAKKDIEVARVESMTMVNAGIADFYSRNGDILQPGAVVLPQNAAQCDVCQSMINGNPWPDINELFRIFDWPPHPNCILPGQDVLMADGSTKDIAHIEVGDFVVNTLFREQVTEIFERNVDELVYHIEVEGRILKATGEHPILTESGWLPVRDLREGQFVMTASVDDTQYAQITKVETESYDGKVYNLTVAGNETYVVNGIVVHNCPHFPEALPSRKLSASECRELWVGV